MNAAFNDLACGVLGGIPVPAGAQGGDQENPVVFAWFPGAWRLRVGIPDLDENLGGGAGQVHRYRLAGPTGGVDRVGDVARS